MGRATSLSCALMTLVAWPAQASAHPGGTDRYGCHVESATGIRHCHNDSAGEAMSVTFGLESSAEASRSYWSDGKEQVGAHGGVYVQHDGTMFFGGGLSAYYSQLGGGSTTFIDIGLGIIWLAHADTALALRTAAGFKIPLFRLGAPHKYGYLKLAGFMELAADGVNAEPVGLHVGVGFNL